MCAGAVLNQNTGAQLEYRDLVKKHRPAQIMDQIIGERAQTAGTGHLCHQRNNNMLFIPKSEVPFDRHKGVTYARIVVAYKLNKLKKNCSRVTVGGDIFNNVTNCSAPTADLPIIKLLQNLVLSTPGAKYFTMDVSNLYLGSPMNFPEFIRIPIKTIKLLTNTTYWLLLMLAGFTLTYGGICRGYREWAGSSTICSLN